MENEGTEGVLMYSKSSSPQPEKCVWFREKYHHSLSSRRSPDIQTDSLSDRFKMSKTIKMSRRLKIFILLPKKEHLIMTSHPSMNTLQDYKTAVASQFEGFVG